MKVGMGSWTFPWAIGVAGHLPRAPMNALGLLAKARSLGAEVVQIADNLPVERGQGAVLREAARGLELELGTRGAAPGNLLVYLEHAVEAGARLLRALPCGPADLVGAIRSVLPDFERYRVVLALENYEHLSAPDLVRVVRELDSPWVGVCLDTVNSLGRLESPSYVIETLAPYTVNVHVKDFEIARIPCQMGFSVSGRPAGQGCLNLASLIQQVRAHGRDPSLILEQWPPFLGTLDETIANEAAWAGSGFERIRRHAA